MDQWAPLVTEKDWDDIVLQHTTDVESLPSLRDDVFVGDYTPDYRDLLRASTHDDPFMLKCVRDQKTGEFLYFKETLNNPDEITDRWV